MKLRTLIPLLIGASLLLSGFNIWVSLQLRAALTLVESIEAHQFKAQELADQLRHTSDDLTRFARKYVQTGDPIFQSRFREVLAIRDGEIPRPDIYDSIYWHLVTAGRLPGPLAERGQAAPLQELLSEL